jgi:palmitoyltransferase ZDHHC13/17
VNVIDLLIQHGADPRLFDTEGYNCLHSVTHSSSYWALLYLLCQPDIAVDERDDGDHTALHWAVYQRDDVSTQILLKMGADPNAVGYDGLSVLHWAAFAGNRKCLRHLLEAGAATRAKNKDSRIAEELATEHHNKGVWDSVIEELGFIHDGTRVRRPLSEVRGCTGASRVLVLVRRWQHASLKRH